MGLLHNLTCAYALSYRDRIVDNFFFGNEEIDQESALVWTLKMEEQGLLGFYFNYESNSSGIIEPPNQFVNNASFIAQNNQSYSYSHEIIFDGYELTAYDTIVAGTLTLS